VRQTNILIHLLCWAMLAPPAMAFTLDLPAKVIGEERRTALPGSYALPLGPFDGTSVPSRQVEGALDQRAFQLEAPGLTTLAVMAPLRDQVLAAGFTILFECETRACGGFDFRFATEVIPEPEMHVDIGDYRFLSAEKDGEAVSILVSRSIYSAFVQITRVNDAPQLVAPLSTAPAQAVVDMGAAEPSGADDAPPISNTAIGQALEAKGSAVLEDLVFASGAAALAEGDYASLAAVAAWLKANPNATIALVGHTDASGSLAANIALSERRAKVVAEALIDLHGADRTRIAAEGVGFLAPRATNQTEDGRQKNRRVEVIVTSTR